MADNVAITAGSGTNVKTDQLAGGEHVQYVKLLDGTADSATVVAATANGLKVDGSAVAQPVTDNAGTLTVDAPVGTPVFVRLSDGTAAQVGQKTMANSLPVVVASDQTTLQVQDSDTSVTGTITTTDVVVAAPAINGALRSGSSTAGSIVSLAVTGKEAFIAQITGLTSGNLYFEGSVDSTNGTDGNWILVPIQQQGTTFSAIFSVMTINAVVLGAIPGIKYVRCRASGALTGTPTVIIRATSTAGASNITNSIPSGSNIIGTVTATQSIASSLKVDLSGTSSNVVGSPLFVRLSDGSAAQVGQKAMTASLPVVVASDQSAISITPPALTKGTQGSTGFTVQDLKDAGRTPLLFHMTLPAITTGTDALVSLTGFKGTAAVVATTTPAVVTTGKTFRVTSITITYVAIATAGSVKMTLRANNAGVVAITSPAVAAWVVGGTAAVAGVAETVSVAIPDGLEFAAGTGIGVSQIGLSTTQTAAAVGYGQIAIVGYEY
jgi:hypothetical protein